MCVSCFFFSSLPLYQTENAAFIDGNDCVVSAPMSKRLLTCERKYVQIERENYVSYFLFARVALSFALRCCLLLFFFDLVLYYSVAVK